MYQTKPLPKSSGGMKLEVAPPGAQSRLVLYPRSVMKDWSERQPSIMFECDDVERTYEELKNRGVEVGGQPVIMKWDKFGTFRDLDGNEFGFKS
jgi:lactoylglutathione lyase